MPEVVPIYDKEGHCYQHDDGLRAIPRQKSWQPYPPFFEPPFGLITAGNSSQITDGAALLLLASEKAVAQYHLPVLGKIIDVQWAALPPEEMGLGPVLATKSLLQRNELNFNDINYWEINEAFAVQTLACLQEFAQPDGISGTINPEHLNVDGGAIALGHPIGASGARIVLHLLHVLRRNNASRGIAAICIGGGQGGAMLLEQGSRS